MAHSSDFLTPQACSTTFCEGPKSDLVADTATWTGDVLHLQSVTNA